MGGLKRLGQAARLAAEDEHVAAAVGHLRVAPRGLRLEEPGRLAAHGGKRRQQVVPGVDHFPLEVVPVVEAGAAEIVVVEFEAERPHQPHLGADSDAGPPHVAGVGWNFGLVKDDMEGGVVTHEGPEGRVRPGTGVCYG